MEVEEAVLVEVLVDGDCHVVADAHHGSEGVGAQTQMCVLAHVFETLPLLLHGIITAAKAIDLNLAALQFDTLSRSLALHKFAVDIYTRTGSYLLKQVGVKLGWVNHHLYVLDGGAVVEGDEIHRLA